MQRTSARSAESIRTGKIQIALVTVFHDVPFNCHGAWRCLLYHFADPPHQIGVQGCDYSRPRSPQNRGLTMTETELKLSAAAIIVGLQDAQKRLENTRSNRHAKNIADRNQTHR